MCRSPTQGKDPYDAFNVASGKARSSDNPPVIPPRLSPESTTLPARSLFSDGLLARLSQDPNLARFLKSSSSNSSDGNNSNSRGNGGQQQTAPSTLYGRRISIESLPLRRYPSIFIITNNNDWLTFVCVCVCVGILSQGTHLRLRTIRHLNLRRGGCHNLPTRPDRLRSRPLQCCSRDTWPTIISILLRPDSSCHAIWPPNRSAGILANVSNYKSRPHHFPPIPVPAPPLLLFPPPKKKKKYQFFFPNCQFILVFISPFYVVNARSSCKVRS